MASEIKEQGKLFFLMPHCAGLILMITDSGKLTRMRYLIAEKERCPLEFNDGV